MIRSRQGSGAVTWEMKTQIRALKPPWWSRRTNQLVIKGNRRLFLRGGLLPRALLCFLGGWCRSGRNSWPVQLPAFFFKLPTASVVFHCARIKHLHQEKFFF